MAPSISTPHVPHVITPRVYGAGGGGTGYSTIRGGDPFMDNQLPPNKRAARQATQKWTSQVRFMRNIWKTTKKGRIWVIALLDWNILKPCFERTRLNNFHYFGFQMIENFNRHVQWQMSCPFVTVVGGEMYSLGVFNLL